jgi:hypothetical protein
MPVWLPTAYARADVNAEYAVFLVALPLAIAFILASFFREVTIANLSDPSDDRSSGLKRWFLTASALVVVIGALPPWILRHDPWVTAMLAQGSLALLSTFTLLVLCAEPVGPSRRVLSQWRRSDASALKRFLGPGLARTLLLLVGVTAIGQAVLTAVGTVASAGSSTGRHGIANALFCGYATCFFAFLAGFAIFTRSLPKGRLPPRATLSLAMFAAVAGPLFVLAIAGLSPSSAHRAYWIAAPSPLYVFALIDPPGISTRQPALSTGVAAMLGWAALGAVLGAVGYRRIEKARRTEEEKFQALEARIRKEDEVVAPPSPAA